MADFQSFDILAFHSCDRELGLQLINGNNELHSSNNDWDWLGPGIYFWEQDPARALEYATAAAAGKQKIKKAPNTPFVVGAVIQMGNCLNLVESTATDILSIAYEGLEKLTNTMGADMLVNNGKNRALDCAFIKYIHESNKQAGKPSYDTIRCAFPEGNRLILAQ